MVNQVWDTILIGDFLSFKNGLNKGKEFFGYGTPIINYTDVYHNSGIRKSDVTGTVSLSYDEIHRYEARKNDVFFTRTSETPEEVGLSAVLLEDIADCAFSGFVLRGRPKNDLLLPEYCQYCFSTRDIREQIIRSCTYTTRALTNGKLLSDIEIPCPPKPEQEAIAKALSDIDELILSIEKTIKKYQAIKQACLQRMFPQNGQSEPKMRLPGFTGAWEQRKFAELFDTLSNNTLSRAELTEETGVGRDVHYGDILVKFGECLGEISELPFIANNQIVQKFSPSRLQNGDVVIADTAEDETVGKCTEILDVQGEIVLAGLHTIPCRPREKFAPAYLGYFMNSSAYHDQLRPLMQGIKVTSVSKSALQDTILFMPKSYDEQEQIGNFFLALDHLITLHQRKLKKYKDIKQGMMDELLTGNTRLQ